MASSGGNTLSQWRLLTQLRNYLSKSHPSIITQSLQDDISTLLKVASSNKFSGTQVHEKKSESPAQQDNKNKDLVSSVAVKDEASRSSYSEVKKALTSLNAYIPQIPTILSRKGVEAPPMRTPEKTAPPKWKLKKKDLISRSSIDARTRHLIRGLDPALNSNAAHRRLEDLCSHLKEYPDTRGVVIKSSGISRLLRILHSSNDDLTKEVTRQVLALIGYTQPVKGNGIRILSIDGGGTRGLVAIDMLRQLESKAGQPIHELFDFVCGVSTGAVIAVLVGGHRLCLDGCEKLYRDISNQIFSQNTFKGTASLVWKNSFYDSNAWTEILKKHMGDTPMIETSKMPDMNKLCLVSTQTNSNWVKAFLFRNYNFPYRMASHFNGSSSARLWEGVRASAAAPGYFSEFTLNEDLILLDGGVMVNNPTAIAIHEARQLWPDTPLQCVVSVGTGRHEPLLTSESHKTSNWASRLKTIINSATDTEGVHTTLHDLLPGNVYFRFNPYLSEEITLDEIRADKLACMMEDTGLYIRKNEAKLLTAIDTLTKPKTFINKSLDHVTLKIQMLGV